MERDKKFIEIKNIFRSNFIGFEEIMSINKKFQFLFIDKHFNKDIPFPIESLREKGNEYILFYFHPILINNDTFSINSLKKYLNKINFKELHFYNQDWYENENFANKCKDNAGWYLLKKSVYESSRGIAPNFNTTNSLYPSASLCTYLFFLNYLVNHTVLWEYDYVWCSDLDTHGDNIYVGRYKDINKINKDGFSIHRHLKIKNNYGVINCLNNINL
jgi:hypothetical protein